MIFIEDHYDINVKSKHVIFLFAKLYKTGRVNKRMSEYEAGCIVILELLREFEVNNSDMGMLLLQLSNNFGMYRSKNFISETLYLEISQFIDKTVGTYSVPDFYRSLPRDVSELIK